MFTIKATNMLGSTIEKTFFSYKEVLEYTRDLSTGYYFVVTVNNNIPENITKEQIEHKLFNTTINETLN